ncbi:hypothetical protein CXB51_008120 [Gossypium anomalum]|uniref:UmuC domain-containing protein n=1 Tax=Gossypium anomalum TaxID=47600 RepID=A0A8J5YV61_9ROSI|nr:hypothetical protein CXB51_008120 [Gossypium anomalum]
MESSSELDRLLFFEQARKIFEATYASNPLDADNLTRGAGALLELSQFQSVPDSQKMIQDMDAFYVAANYEARKFGVRAAMTGFIALKLCPDLIFVPTVFWNYDPNFMAASLDEAYLDITKVCEKRSITGAEIAEELRSRVYEETGLTCSAGVAPNRLLAKVLFSVLGT